MMRRPLACLLTLSLLLTGPGAPVSAFAADSVKPPPDNGVRIPTETAKQVFEKHHFFTGKDDVLRTYAFEGDGKLSKLGEVFYQYILSGGDGDVIAAMKGTAGGGAMPDDATIAKRIEELKESLDSLRELGAATPKMRVAAAQSIQQTRDRFFQGKYEEMSDKIKKGKAEPMTLKALFSSAYDGAAGAAQQKEPEYIQVTTPDGYVFLDKDGEALRLSKNMVCRHSNWDEGTEPVVMTLQRFETFKADREAAGQFQHWQCGEGSGATIFSRALREQQEKMNDPSIKPSCAPDIPLTGRYNYEMLQYSACKIEQQVQQLELDYITRRMQNMDQMVGGNHAPSQYSNDDLYNYKLLKAIEKQAAKKSLEKYTEKDETCPGAKNVLAYADCKYAQTRKRLDEAKAVVAKYKERAAQFKGRRVISNAEIEGMQNDEKKGSKGILSAYLEVAKQQVTNQLEMLSHEVKYDKDRNFADIGKSGGTGKSWLTEWDWKKPGLPTALGGTGISPFKWKEYESPDSKYLRENLDDAPWSDETKEEYLKRREDLAYRLGRLNVVLTKLDTELGGADHMTGLGPIQSVLGATQTELGDVSLDISMFATVPALAKVAHEESNGVTNAIIYAGHKAVNWVSRAIFDGSWGSRYLKDRDTLENALPKFKEMGALLAGGKFDAARKALIAMDPSALKESWSVPIYGDGSPDTTDGMRVQAAFENVQKAIGYVAERNMLAGSVVNTALWSVALGVAAPAVSVVAGGVGRTAATVGGKLAGVTGKAAIVMRPIGYSLKAVGAILEHFAIRLQSLSPASDQLYASSRIMRSAEAMMIRSANAGLRIGSFGVLAGGVSAGFGAGMHLYNKALGDGNSPMPSAAEAAWTSFKHGSKWASDSWHPLILFAGLPSNAFDGIPGVSSMANSIAHRGVMGNAAAATRNIGGALGKGISWASRGHVTFKSTAGLIARAADLPGVRHIVTGAKWLTSNPIVVLADHIGKFVVVSQGAGKIARTLSMNYNTVDEKHIERRIKRAEAAAMHHMEAPWWLLLPVGAAKTEMQALEHQRTQQGVKEYLDAGEGHRLAKMVPEVTELALKHKPKVPLMQRFFNARIRGEKGGTGTFKITKELHYEVVRKILPGEIDLVRGGKIIPAAEKHLSTLYEIAQGKVKRVGRLEVTDIIIDQAGELFDQVIAKSPAMRQKILGIDPKNLGKPVKGYGIVDAKIQKEFARSIWRNDGNPAYKLKPSEVAAAKKILGAELETELKVAQSADRLYSALEGNKSPSKAFQKLMKETLEDITAWKDENKSMVKKYGEDYMNILEHLKQKSKTMKFSPAEDVVIKQTVEYVQTIRERFQHFNKVGEAHVRAQQSIRSRLNQVEAQPGHHGPEVKQLLDLMNKKLSAWHGQQRDANAPAGKGYDAMIKELSEHVNAFEGKIADGDFTFMRQSVKEMDSAPWILRDSKGTNLRDWRPVQFEGLMYFLDSMMSKGADAAQTVRTFLMMKTGSGKTFIAYEGLLPFAEAVAKQHGLKTVFLTVQSNLESQARIEFRAMNKLRTGLEFDTWEGFKSRIAQGKLDFGMKPEKYFILGDEMDGAALQPALTIGETTATVSRWSVGYEKLKPTYSRLREILDRGSVKLKSDLDGAVIRRKSIIEGMPEGPAKQAMIKSVKELNGIVNRLTQLQTRTYAAPAERAEILSQARGALKRIASRGLTTVRGGRGPVDPAYRTQAQIESLTRQIEMQRSLMEDPKLHLAARQKAMAQKLGEAWDLLGWGKKAGAKARTLNETLAALEKKAEGHYAAGETAEAMRLEGSANNLKSLTQSIEGLGKQAKEFAANPAKIRKAAQVEIGRLEKSLSAVRQSAKNGQQIAQVQEPGVKDTISALQRDAQQLRQSGKTDAAVKLEAKAQMLKDFNGAIEALDKQQTAPALRRQARELQHRADILDQGKDPAAQKLRQQAAELESRATQTERDPGMLKSAMDNVNARLRDVFEADIAFQQKAASVRMRSVLKGQEKHAAQLDKATAEKFKTSDAEIKDVLNQRETTVRGDRSTALTLHEEMMLKEKSIFAQTEPAGAKLAKNLRKMAQQALKQGNVKQAEKIQGQADKIAGEGRQAREALKANSKRINEIMQEGKEGWEGRTRELLKKREALVERAVEKENPIYEIFREMRDSMYSHVYSQTRVNQEFQTLEHAPRSARQTLLENGSAPRKHAKALVEELKRMKADGGGGKGIDSRIQKGEALLDKLNKKAKALYAERQKLKDFETQAQKGKHQSLMEAGKEQELVVDQAAERFIKAQRDVRQAPENKAFTERLKQAEAELDAANNTLKDTNSKLREFNRARSDGLSKTLKNLEQQAKVFEAEVAADIRNLTDGWKGAPRVRSHVEGITREIGSSTRRLHSNSLRLKLTPEAAEGILRQRLDGVSTPKLAMAYALEAPRLAVTNLHRVPLIGKLPPVRKLSSWASSNWKGVQAKEGLSRYYGRRLLSAFLSDPLIPPGVRWRMFWTLLPSTFKGRGSWVQGELFNMANGYVEPTRTIRMDHINGKVNVVHNGQWFESMDTATRRFWELEYGADLTLPYDSQTIATIKDITSNTKVRFVGFSGTAGKEFRARLTPYKIELTGHGSLGVKNIDLEIHSNPSGKMQSIQEGLRRNLIHDFQQIDAGGQADSLLVLSLPDTRVVKQVVKSVLKNGLTFGRTEVSPKVMRTLLASGYDVKVQGEGVTVRLSNRHLAKVFSDAELLRTQMPDAKVENQMNLDGLTPGKVKILILDTRVGGRGLDLNFKGQRGAGPFEGYNHFEMQLHDPQVASEAHFLQAQGRIDVGRVKKGAVRTFRMVMDVPSSSREVIFLKMLRDEPLMAQLRQRPEVVRSANERGHIHPEWVDIHRYVEDLQIKVALAKDAGPLDKVHLGYEKLIKNYYRTVERNLDAQKLEIEKDQLRSSSVLQDQAMFNWLMRGMSLPAR